VYAALDTLLICALTYESGGAFSELRHLFLVLPLGGVFTMRPESRPYGQRSPSSPTSECPLLHPAVNNTADFREVVFFSLYLIWAGIASVLLSTALAWREKRIAEISSNRGQLVAQAIDAEERARRRLAIALHEDLLQNVLAARQDIEEARDGDPRR